MSANMKKTNSLLQKNISKPILLPPLAKNIHLLMRSLADDNLTYQQLAEVIKHYPAITARIIFLANSSWSAPISPIDSIEQACSRLGNSIIKSICIAISVASSFDTRRCPFFNTTHFWTTSMLVAEGAKLLTAKLPKHLTNPGFENTAQTAGILHNLGILWLADNLPIETNKALEMVAEENSSLSVSDSLRLYAETDYCEIGSWMALQLKLPNILNIAIKYHLTPEYQEASYEIAQLVGLAANMASAIHKQEEGIPTHTQLEKLGLNSATQNLIYQQLSVNYEKTHGLAQTLFEGSVS